MLTLRIEKKPPFYLSNRWDLTKLLDDLDNRLLIRQQFPAEHYIMQMLQRIADGWTGFHRRQTHATIDCGGWKGRKLDVQVDYSIDAKTYLFKGKLDGKLVAAHQLPVYKMVEREINNAT